MSRIFDDTLFEIISNTRRNDYPDYNDFEYKTISLVEARGIASFNEQNVVEEIYEFINNKLQLYSNKVIYKEGLYNKQFNVKFKDFKVDIPSKICSKFKNIPNLGITIKIRDFKGIQKKDFNQHGNGESTLYKKENVNFTPHITISTFALDSNVLYYDFIDSFNHEYNHVFEDYNRFLKIPKNENVDNVLKTLQEYATNKNYNSILKLFDENNVETKSFASILYILWNKSEFNAWTTSSYSYLKSIDSDIKNFKDDVKNCDGYKKYREIKDIFLPEIVNCKNTMLWLRIYNTVTTTPLDRNNKEALNILKQFKKRFIKYTESYLDKFWVKLSRNASIWFEEKNNI